MLNKIENLEKNFSRIAAVKITLLLYEADICSDRHFKLYRMHNFMWFKGTQNLVTFQNFHLTRKFGFIIGYSHVGHKYTKCGWMQEKLCLQKIKIESVVCRQVIRNHLKFIIYVIKDFTQLTVS